MNKLKSKKFPGIDQVLQVLPYPGELFWDFFTEHFSRINFRPVLSAGTMGQYVKLEVCRSSDVLFPQYQKKDLPKPRIFLPQFGRLAESFTIRKEFVGKSFKEIHSLWKSHLKTKIMETLSQKTVHLKVEGTHYPDIREREYFWQFFVPGSHPQHAIETSLTVTLDEEADYIQGFDRNKMIRLVSWKDLIPRDSTQYEAIKSAVRWYRNWIALSEAIKYGVQESDLNLINIWEKCQTELIGALEKC